MFNIGRESIAVALDHLCRTYGGLPLLEFRYDDPRVAWNELIRCTHGGVPGLDVGQSRDCRWPLADGRSLHAHWHDGQGFARFHLDRVDPERDGLGHLVSDTAIPGGALLGAVIVGLLTKSWKGAAAGALLGGAAGAVKTAAESTVYHVASIQSDGSMVMQRGSTTAFQTA